MCEQPERCGEGARDAPARRPVGQRGPTVGVGDVGGVLPAPGATASSAPTETARAGGLAGPWTDTLLAAGHDGRGPRQEATMLTEDDLGRQ